MTRKTFPITAECSLCHHTAEIFVDDAMLAEQLDAYRKSRVDRLWGALIVRRVAALLVVAFVLGLALGRWAR